MQLIPQTKLAYSNYTNFIEPQLTDIVCKADQQVQHHFLKMIEQIR
jgi:hypothetical protein